MTPHKHSKERKFVIKIIEKSIEEKKRQRERLEINSPLMQQLGSNSQNMDLRGGLTKHASITKTTFVNRYAFSVWYSTFCLFLVHG